MELTELAGIGPVRAETLRAMGIFSLRDLLFTLPERYEDHATVYPCNTRKEGSVLVAGRLSGKPRLSYHHGLKIVNAGIEDETGRLAVCWYNTPWIIDALQEGKVLRLYGRISIKNNRRVMQNPRFSTEEGLVPVYRALKGFPAKSFRKLIRSALEKVDDCCPETLPTSFRLRNRLCELNYAIRQAHFPSDLNALQIAFGWEDHSEQRLRTIVREEVRAAMQDWAPQAQPRAVEEVSAAPVDDDSDFDSLAAAVDFTF